MAEELGIKAMVRRALIGGKNLNVFWKMVICYTDGPGGLGHKKAQLSGDENELLEHLL